MPTEVTDANFKETVLKQEKAIVDFWAEWCGPCHLMAPRFDELSNEMKDVKFYKVDVDHNNNIAIQYQIRSIPTLIMFRKGEPVGRVIGALPKESLKDKILQVFSA